MAGGLRNVETVDGRPHPGRPLRLPAWILVPTLLLVVAVLVLLTDPNRLAQAAIVLAAVGALALGFVV